MNMGKSSTVKFENVPIVDNQGYVYVLSVFNDAVYKYSGDGVLVMAFGKSNNEYDDIDNADAFAIDGKGNVYIADSDQIHFYRPDGRFVRRFDAARLMTDAA